MSAKQWSKEKNEIWSKYAVHAILVENRQKVNQKILVDHLAICDISVRNVNLSAT